MQTFREIIFLHRPETRTKDVQPGSSEDELASLPISNSAEETMFFQQSVFWSFNLCLILLYSTVFISGASKISVFLSWTPCRCLISVKNSQKNCESTTRSWKNRALQEAIPCLWAIIHRHILSSNSSRLDASNMGKHVQVGKMHQFFWDKSTMKEWKAHHGNLMLCQVYQTQYFQAYLLSSPSQTAQKNGFQALPQVSVPGKTAGSQALHPRPLGL